MKPLEKHIQQSILDYLTLNKILAWINKTQGTYDPNKNIFRRHGTRRGVSDILGLLPDGVFLAIEVKRPKAYPSAEQKKFLADINANNGLGFVARSIEDVFNHLRQHDADLKLLTPK